MVCAIAVWWKPSDGMNLTDGRIAGCARLDYGDPT